MGFAAINGKPAVVCRRIGMRWKMAAKLISPIEHPSETFECLDCSLVDTLDEHGRCARCGSNAVMQYMAPENAGYWIKIGDAPYWVSTSPAEINAADVNAADDALRFSEHPRHCRKNARSAAPKTSHAPIRRKKCA